MEKIVDRGKIVWYTYTVENIKEDVAMVTVSGIKEKMMSEINQGIISATYGMLINPSIHMGRAEALMWVLESAGVKLDKDSDERTKLNELRRILRK